MLRLKIFAPPYQCRTKSYIFSHSFWPRPLTNWTFKICNIYSKVLSATDPRADQVVIQSKDSARWPGIAPASQDTRLHNVHDLCQRLSTYSSPGSQLYWVCSISWLPKRWDHDLKLFRRLVNRTMSKAFVRDHGLVNVVQAGKDCSVIRFFLFSASYHCINKLE